MSNASRRADEHLFAPHSNTMPRTATLKRATAAKATKPRKAAAAKKPAAPSLRKRVKLQPTSGESLKENETQLAVAERMLAELASREKAETDPAVAAQRALRSAILTGAVSPGATILKPAPRLKSQSELDAEARLAADKAAATAAKATAKAARDTLRSREIAAELARILPPPVVMTGAPSYAPALTPAPSPAPAPAPAPAPSSWLGALSAALLPPPSEPTTAPAKVRKTAAEKEAKKRREADVLAEAISRALAASGVSASAASAAPRVATGVPSYGPPPSSGPPPSGPPPSGPPPSGPPLPPSGPPRAPAGPGAADIAAAAAAASKTLKKRTPEELAASDAARAAKAAAAALAKSKTPKATSIPRFASESERYDDVNKTTVRLTESQVPMYNRLAVWQGRAQVAYMKQGIPITKDLLTLGPDGWPVENDAAIAAAVAAKKSGMPGTSASASIGTDTGPEDPLADKVVLKSDGTIFKTYKWDSKALKKAMIEGVVRTGVDGRLYRRSVEEINAEREALAAATAAPLPKAGPSTALSEAETAVPALPTPASPPRLTDAEVEALLSGEGRGSRSEIQAVGFPQDSWTPAQARRWLKEHDAMPIKGMRREGSWLRWRITPPERYSRYTTKTLKSNGKTVHLVLGWR